MKPHKHAELIKVWLDNQDAVSFQGKANGKWVHVDISFLINESYVCAYRIDPNCEYAIEKIRELGGDEAVELYQYWLGGGTLQGEIFKCTTVEDFLPPSCDPFQGFQGIMSYHNVSKKKQTVKQVLWIGVAVIGDSVVLQSLWLNKGDTPAENDFCKYHIAPGYENGIEL